MEEEKTALKTQWEIMKLSSQLVLAESLLKTALRRDGDGDLLRRHWLNQKQPAAVAIRLNRQ